jgi:hypothetical protein
MFWGGEEPHSTFGDLDGRQLQFPEGVKMRPSKQLLGLHAVTQERASHHRIPGV